MTGFAGKGCRGGGDNDAAAMPCEGHTLVARVLGPLSIPDLSAREHSPPPPPRAAGGGAAPLWTAAAVPSPAPAPEALRFSDDAPPRQPRPVVVWFRGHDLRVRDHPALAAAVLDAAPAPVVALFVAEHPRAPWSPPQAYPPAAAASAAAADTTVASTATATAGTAAPTAAPGGSGSSSCPPMGPVQRWHLHYSLLALERQLAELGIALAVREGDPTYLVPAFAAELDAAAVLWLTRFKPKKMALECTVADALVAKGIRACPLGGELLVPPHLVNQTFNNFHSFLSFWLDTLRNNPPPRPAPPLTRSDVRAALPADHIPANNSGGLGGGIHSLKLLETLGDEASFCTCGKRRHRHGARIVENCGTCCPTTTGAPYAKIAPGDPRNVGCVAAEYALDQFLDSARFAGFADPATRRDGMLRPDHNTTSHLSPHIRFGEFSPRRLFYAVVDAGARTDCPAAVVSARAFLKNMCLREFGHYMLNRFPDAAFKPIVPEYECFPWTSDPDGTMTDAWRTGRTGYPLIDAAMRQLAREGWIHNRLRFLVAAFYCKFLLLPWHIGAAYLVYALVDGDDACNSLGWQWTMGCNSDALPSNFQCNPIAADANGARSVRFCAEYIRDYVPELAHLPDAYIFEPWLAPRDFISTSTVISDVRACSSYPPRVIAVRDAKARMRSSIFVMRRIFQSHKVQRVVIEVQQCPDDRDDNIHTNHRMHESRDMCSRGHGNIGSKTINLAENSARSETKWDCSDLMTGQEMPSLCVSTITGSAAKSASPMLLKSKVTPSSSGQPFTIERIDMEMTDGETSELASQVTAPANADGRSDLFPISPVLAATTQVSSPIRRSRSPRSQILFRDGAPYPTPKRPRTQTCTPPLSDRPPCGVVEPRHAQRINRVSVQSLLSPDIGQGPDDSIFTANGGNSAQTTFESPPLSSSPEGISLAPSKEILGFRSRARVEDCAKEIARLPLGDHALVSSAVSGVMDCRNMPALHDVVQSAKTCQSSVFHTTPGVHPADGVTPVSQQDRDTCSRVTTSDGHALEALETRITGRLHHTPLFSPKSNKTCMPSYSDRHGREYQLQQPDQQPQYKPQQLPRQKPQEQAVHQPEMRSPQLPSQQTPQMPVQQTPQMPVQQTPQMPVQQPPQMPVQQPPQMPVQQPPRKSVHQPPQKSVHQPPQKSVHQSPRKPMRQPPQKPMQQHLQKPILEPPQPPTWQPERQSIRQPPQYPTQQLSLQQSHHPPQLQSHQPPPLQSHQPRQVQSQQHPQLQSQQPPHLQSHQPPQLQSHHSSHYPRQQPEQQNRQPLDSLQPQLHQFEQQRQLHLEQVPANQQRLVQHPSSVSMFYSGLPPHHQQGTHHVYQPVPGQCPYPILYGQLQPGSSNHRLAPGTHNLTNTMPDCRTRVAEPSEVSSRFPPHPTSDLTQVGNGTLSHMPTLTTSHASSGVGVDVGYAHGFYSQQAYAIPMSSNHYSGHPMSSPIGYMAHPQPYMGHIPFIPHRDYIDMAVSPGNNISVPGLPCPAEQPYSQRIIGPPDSQTCVLPVEKHTGSNNRPPTNRHDREEIARRMAAMDYENDVYGGKHREQWQAIALHLLKEYEFTDDTDRKTSKHYVRLCALKDELRSSSRVRITVNHTKEFFRILNLVVTGEWDRRGHGGVRGPYVYGIRSVSDQPPQEASHS